MEFLLQKVLDNVHIVPTISFFSKINKHMPHGYIQIRSFHNKKSEHDIFSAYLKEHATETINCEKKVLALKDHGGNRKNLEEVEILSHMERRIRRRI